MTTENKLDALVSTWSPGKQDGISLHHMVDRLVAGIVPDVARRGSFMVNEIPQDLVISGNPDIMVAVLDNLLSAIARHTENSCIRITSKQQHSLVVQLKNTCNANAYTIAGTLQEIVPLAEKIGGNISISSQEEKLISIVFNYPALPFAA